MPNRELFHSSADAERLFAACFGETFNTLLCGDVQEPLYLPAGKVAEEAGFQSLALEKYEAHQRPVNLLFYRQDYFASALHEVSHWCIAGEARRKQVDFGYWYEPDGRNAKQQAAFFSVEVKPQALELLFNLASGRQFEVSVDNLSSYANSQQESTVKEQIYFSNKVYQQAVNYLQDGLPDRARQFISVLGREYLVEIDSASLHSAVRKWQEQCFYNVSERQLSTNEQ